jgi:hypothetical protein
VTQPQTHSRIHGGRNPQMEHMTPRPKGRARGPTAKILTARCRCAPAKNTQLPRHGPRPQCVPRLGHPVRGATPDLALSDPHPDQGSGTPATL